MINFAQQDLVFTAIFWGVIAGLGLSAIAGTLLGAGLLSDIVAGKEGAEPVSPDDETEMANAMERAMSRPVALLQITVLSLVAAAVSGALTARLAPAAPYLNAGIVGLAGTLGALPFAGHLKALPRPLIIFSIIATLPATLAGAWLVS